MKRFKCSECKKVVRVRRLPDNVSGESGAFHGRCNWHNFPSHGDYILAEHRAGLIAPGEKTKKSYRSSSPPPSNTKKNKSREAAA